MNIRARALEITVFVCGGVVMIFELAGARILGPYFGTSIFVWTSIIGIILGSLSFGYYYGGKIADKRPHYAMLSRIIFFAAIFIGLTTIIKAPLLLLLSRIITDIKLASVVAAILLFMPASALLGMVSPYAAKLKITELSTSGSTVGNLYALSTTGSILGTFLSGFYLIPNFGTNNILIILFTTLIIISYFLSSQSNNTKKVLLLSCFIILFLVTFVFRSFNADNGIIDIDTAYNRIWITDQFDTKTSRMIRLFAINNERSSAMFLDSDELVHEYAKYYHLSRHFFPQFKKTLMLGGAGYSYPRDFLSVYPNATIDVIEIDPEVTDIAKTYFRLQDDPRMTIYHADARVHLNRTDKMYDVIYGDAFTSQNSLPYQLTTQEAIQKKYDVLNDGGVVIVNLISSLEGSRSLFLRAEYATYASVFPQVYLFPVDDMEDTERVQNVILVALKSDETPSFESDDSQLQAYLQRVWTQPVETDLPILTDDFAPVDHYIGKTI